MMGWVAGCALQLQQATLSASLGYGVAIFAGFVVGVLLWHNPRGWFGRRGRASGLALLAGLALGWGITGLRSHYFQSGALDPTLEGRDVWVTGVVTDPPQHNASGMRFRFRVEAAMLEGQPLALPGLMDVGWYSGASPNGIGGIELLRQPQTVSAGERWSLLLRLKAPHGSRNPYGFDYELWLWDQGVQATAYVRSGPRDAPALALGQTYAYPVALARQRVREAIYAEVDDRATAGVIAALVMGDQGAIDHGE